MSKYLDSNGLLYLWSKIKAKFSVIGHTHTVSVSTGDSVSVTAGTAASLTTTNISIPNISKKTVVTGVTKKTVVTGGTTTGIPNVTDVGSTPTLGTAFTIPNVTSVGSTPTLGTQFTIPNISVSTKSIPNVTSVGSAATASVSNGVLTLTNGTAPTLGTAISVGSASAGTAFKVPNVTGVGSTPTLGTAFTVPNVTGVGSTPTLGDDIEAYTELSTGDSVTVTTGDSITVGTATSAKGVDTFTPNTPTSVTKKTVVTSVGSTTGASTS